MEEVWKPIESFERYEVSTMGNVRRGEKLLVPGLDSDGYQQVNLYTGGKRCTQKVHRLVMDAFNTNTENKPQIDHINRERTDNRLQNLRWVTASENVRNSKWFTDEMYGLSWNKKNSSYVVRVNVEGKERYFGSRKTLEDAKTLRDDIINGRGNFVPRKQREMYGISLLSRGFYQIRVNGTTIGYRKTLEEAKHLRDEHIVRDNENR